jgi:hypothetical protein
LFNIRPLSSKIPDLWIQYIYLSEILGNTWERGTAYELRPKPFRSDVRNNASHHVIWRFSLGNTWHELAAPLWVLSAAIPI